jgi:hypothetical protein
METKGNIFILAIKIQPTRCCYLEVRLRFQIILTTPIIQKFKWQTSIRKDTKEKKQLAS